jgi:hypothetical protein
LESAGFWVLTPGSETLKPKGRQSSGLAFASVCLAETVFFGVAAKIGNVIYNCFALAAGSPRAD